LGDFNFEDMKGVSIMKVEDMVKVAVKGMQTDRFEIRPGQAESAQNDESLGAWIYFETNSRSVDRMLQNTESIRTNNLMTQQTRQAPRGRNGVKR